MVDCPSCVEGFASGRDSEGSRWLPRGMRTTASLNSSGISSGGSVHELSAMARPATKGNRRKATVSFSDDTVDGSPPSRAPAAVPLPHPFRTPSPKTAPVYDTVKRRLK